MGELLPYENELANQLQNLPLPDENTAWADMKRRLDEDDDNIIPVWWRGCTLWSLLALLLLVAGWLFIKHTKDNPLKQTSENISTIIKQENKQNNNSQSVITVPSSIKDTINKGTSYAPANTKLPVKRNIGDSVIKKDTIAQSKENSNVENYTGKQTKVFKRSLIESNSGKIKIKTANPIIENNTALQATATKYSKTTKRKLTKPRYKKIKNNNGTSDEAIDDTELEKPVNPKAFNDEAKDNGIANENTVDSVSKHVQKPLATIVKDSVQKAIADTVQKKKGQTIISAPQKKKDNKKKEPLWFSAGIAFNQQLPIAGQTLTTYNAEGRKGNLADYIPSVYTRMYKGNKWFIQAEFRYGAPQNTKDITFQERKDTASGQAFNNDTTNHLKKTYYNQLPVTFNYFVLPNWSVGGGFIWNKFTSAVSEQEINKHDNFNNTDSTLSKGVISSIKNADSNFVSSYFQYILETQYRWKKVSLGIRYTFGLQPYLKFTLPGGTEQKEKNQSFLLFIRYELWRSKRK